jgi:two-component system, LuxR family, sensor kinase FixL
MPVRDETHCTLFDIMAQGVIYQNPAGKIISANPAAEKILGLALHQMQGHTPAELHWSITHEDGSAFAWETHPAVVAQKTGKRVSSVVMGLVNTKSDRRTWISIDATPEFRPGEDTPFRVCSVFEDITKSKRAQVDFENMFHLSQDMLCVASPEGEFLRVSPSFETVLGFTAEEVRGLGWSALVHPDDLEPTQREVAEQLEGKDTVNFVNRYRCKDGTYKTIEWQGTFAANGYLYGAGRDIAKRLQAERELCEAAIYLDVMGDALLVVDTEQAVLQANKAATELWGYDTKEEMRGLNLSILVPERTLGRHRTEMTEASSSDSIRTFESLALTKNGTEVPTMLTGAAMKGPEGELLGFVGVFRDISERKQLESALACVADEERERLRRDLHDGIGQELTGMRFLIAGLRRKLSDAQPEVDGMAARIESIATDALVSVRQLARELAPIAKDAAALIPCLSDLAIRVTEQFEVECHAAVEGSLLIEDAAMANQLFLIAREAVMNAVKHAQASRIDISLESTDGFLKLAVQDDGIGFSHTQESSGLGLHIMRRRAELIGGEFDIRRRNPRGTLVTCLWKNTPGMP